MKKKRLISIILIILLFALCLLLFWKNNSSQKSKISIENPEKISQIQFRVFKIPKEEYPSEKLESLLKCLEETVPVDSGKAKTLERGDDFTSVLLIYEDGSKDKFFFFKDHEKWYLETDDGVFYENAEFIEDYVTPGELQAQEPPVLRLYPDTLDIYASVFHEWETSDTEFETLYYRERYEKQGFSKEDSILKTEQKLSDRQKLFDYAEKEGFFPSEEEQDRLVEEAVLAIQETENYEECNELCQEYGFSLEDTVRMSKDSIVEEEIRDVIYRRKALEFMEGNDSIDGHVCEDLNEYYTLFLRTYVYEKSEWDSSSVF